MDDAEWLNLTLEDLMGESGERNGGFSGFLLMGSAEVQSKESLNNDDSYHTWSNDGLETIDMIDTPIPIEEFSEADLTKYGNLIRNHQGHLMLSIWPSQCDIWDAGYRYLARMEEEIIRHEATAVYTAGRIIPAKEFLTENCREIPMHNWISFFTVQNGDGVDGYTIGLEDFGGKELEIHGFRTETMNSIAEKEVKTEENVKAGISPAKTVMNTGAKKISSAEEAVRHILEQLVMDILQNRRFYQAGEICSDAAGNRYRLKQIHSRYFDGHPLLLQPMEAEQQ